MAAKGLERGCFSRQIASAVVLFVLGVGAVWGQGKAPPTIEEIQKAWQARQDRVRTARFTWKEQRTWPKGSISDLFALMGPAAFDQVPAAKGKVMPPADTTVDFFNTVTLAKDKVRLEYEGQEWSHGKQAFRPVSYLSVFDGKSAKHVYGRSGDAYWPQGIVHDDKDYRDAGRASLLPLLLVYRPFAAKLKPTDLRILTLGEQRKLIDRAPCIELFQRLPRNSSVHFWVDPARSFVLVRRLIVEQGKPFEQIDIRYRHDPGIGWVVAGWKLVNHGHNPGLFCSMNSVLATTEFNGEVDPNSFDIEFPPGARVSNHRTREEYILRPDGTKRRVLPEDIGATYEQMLKTDPGEALRPQRPLMPLWAWILVVLGGLVALGLFVWRRLHWRKPLAGG